MCQSLGHLGGEKVGRPIGRFLWREQFHFGFRQDAKSAEPARAILVRKFERRNREVWLSGVARRNAVWCFYECLCCGMGRQKRSDRRRRCRTWAARSRGTDEFQELLAGASR